MNGHMSCKNKMRRAKAILKSAEQSSEKLLKHMEIADESFSTRFKVKRSLRIKLFRLKQQAMRRVMSANSALKCFYFCLDADPDLYSDVYPVLLSNIFNVVHDSSYIFGGMNETFDDKSECVE